MNLGLSRYLEKYIVQIYSVPSSTSSDTKNLLLYSNLLSDNSSSIYFDIFNLPENYSLSGLLIVVSYNLGALPYGYPSSIEFKLPLLYKVANIEFDKDTLMDSYYKDGLGF